MSEENKTSLALQEIILPKEGQNAAAYKAVLINAEETLPGKTGTNTYASYDKYLLSAAKIVALIWEQGLIDDDVVIHPTKTLKDNETGNREIAVAVLRIIHAIRKATKQDLLVNRPANAVEPEVVKLGRTMLEAYPGVFESLPGGTKAAKILESRDVAATYQYPQMQGEDLEIAKKQIEEISKGIDGSKDVDGLKDIVTKASKKSPADDTLKALKKDLIGLVVQVKNKQQAFEGVRGYHK